MTSFGARASSSLQGVHFRDAVPESGFKVCDGGVDYAVWSAKRSGEKAEHPLLSSVSEANNITP